MHDRSRIDIVSLAGFHEAGKGVPMPGETDLHRTLKKEACRWLFHQGYRCVAAEVKLPPLGIVDAVGAGVFGPWRNQLHLPRAIAQVCIIECKASRSDFLRDQSHDGQLQLCIFQRQAMRRRRPRRGAKWRYRDAVGLGKFKSCLIVPMANLHYILAPAGVVKKQELPPRWGLLSFGEGGISVVHRAGWQECEAQSFVETQIARTLTCDIHNADLRAMNSVNREMLRQQQALASRIRAISPVVA
ncbi:MAG: hypothetical protein NZ561_11750 [Phycisphaerae bacterium]|nr:hypothetical protein [Phycisphaerae bacterium]MDW8262925.1 hypothetical protein [Phycisphaerales bacterium]